jgi:Rad3-related DNA helicase
MQINISVRGLVEFILRQGDIDNRIHTSAENAMLEGGRIHRKIQKMQGSSYHAEVPLSYNIHTSKYDLIIEGRADGIEEGDPVVIDEIKGTYRNLDHMEEPVPVHLAQAKVYAAIYLIQNSLKQIGVRMTYCSLENEAIKYFNFTYSASEIVSWFEEVVDKYKVFADFEAEWSSIRTSSIKSCNFPFPYRKGQKELASGVYRTIVHGKKLFLEAPTGTGKTITTLFPSIAAIGQGKAEKIFYMTAKTLTAAAASDTFQLLRSSQKLRFKTAVITAKDKICLCAEKECNPEKCPYAKGHYDRINEAMLDMMANEDNYTRDTIQYYARKHMVCPFELSLDISLFADGIICDYNYVFDPFVYLKRYFAENKKGSYIFLIDEAHNLVDRGRSMYSADLKLSPLQNLKDMLDSVYVPFKGHMTALYNQLISMSDSDRPQMLDTIEPLIVMADRLSTSISSYLDDVSDGPYHDEIVDYYFELTRFLTIYDKLDDHYRIYQEWDEIEGFRIRLLCVNPSENLGACMSQAVSTILFSATFLPIQYYKELLGGTDEDFEMYSNSSFDPSKRCLVIAGDVTSRYARRGPEQYDRIADYIHRIVSGKRGNYMVFFPSHVFLEEVYEVYLSRYAELDGAQVLAQGSNMSEEEREMFLDMFSEGNNVNLGELINMDVDIEDDRVVIGFCVIGGIFSESIDLRKDSLIGSIIIGCGIPLVCNEREVLRHYFDENGKDGYDFAYKYPGMNKVLQAAGRVIRTEEDTGVVALMDDRFLQSGYRSLFPREWKDIETVTTDTVNSKIEEFWSKISHYQDF